MHAVLALVVALCFAYEALVAMQRVQGQLPPAAAVAQGAAHLLVQLLRCCPPR